MEVVYQKGKNKRFMLIDGEKEDLGYELQMMKDNEVESLLPFYTVEKDGKIQYWYDVTGQRSVEEYFEQEGLSVEGLYKILLCLKLSMDEIQEYLIREDHILLKPSTIFVKNGDQDKLSLCFYPYSEAGGSFSEFGDYIINNANHEDQRVMMLCYRLYEIIMSPGFLYSDLVNEIKKEMAEKEKVVEDVSADRVEVEEKGFLASDGTGFGKNTEDSLLGMKSDALTNYEESYIGRKTDSRDAFEGNIKNANNDSYSVYSYGETDSVQYEESFGDRIMIKLKEKAKNFVKRISQSLPFLKMDDEPVQDSALQDNSGRLLYEGDGVENDFYVDKKVFKIGRDKHRVDGLLHSNKISRQQSVIERKNGHFYLKDLRSKNGTFHNGRRLEKGECVLLNEMDAISFANVPYRWA